MFEVATDSSRGKYKIEAREEFEILSKSWAGTTAS